MVVNMELLLDEIEIKAVGATAYSLENDLRIAIGGVMEELRRGVMRGGQDVNWELNIEVA